MKIYTIGFTKKSAETFFGLLEKNKVTMLLDIRLNNSSQLSGFAKGSDLEYFTKRILNIPYIHDTRLSPTKELYESYKPGLMSKEDFKEEFITILKDRGFEKIIIEEYKDRLEGICLLCSEAKADGCHRKFVAEYIQKLIPLVEIVDL